MPLTALSYLFAAVLAKVVLKEQISWVRWTGILVIVIGVALVAAEERHQRTVEVPLKTALRVILGKKRD
jgi:drug/metabolite transporter (DMT)-like permease